MKFLQAPQKLWGERISFPHREKGKWYLMEGRHRGHEQLRMFLECIFDNFLIQVTKDLMKGDAVISFLKEKS